ncbi:MAG: CoA-binding protein [Ignavibacteria bacterium]|nr:CoA-binding protein [Ignavibacteria bacterium]
MRNICEILKGSKTIAVVGISDNPMRDSGHIALFLKSKGFDVVGVNPQLKEFDGIKVYPTLKEIPHPIDIVNIFRRSEFVGEIVDQAIDIKAKVIWMQLGVINYEAEKKAIENGLEVIMDHCIAVECRNCNI